MWLLFQPGVDGLIDGLLAAGKQVFLDCKMYDIGETVRRGVAAVARRGVSIVTVHGDPDMLRAAVEGRGDSALRIFAVSVLTSQDQAALQAMGYDRPLQEIVDLRVRHAAAAGCDGIIASAADDPDALRRPRWPGRTCWSPRPASVWPAAPRTTRSAPPRRTPRSRGAPITWWSAARSPAPPIRKRPRQTIIELMRQGWERRSPAAR